MLVARVEKCADIRLLASRIADQTTSTSLDCSLLSDRAWHASHAQPASVNATSSGKLLLPSESFAQSHMIMISVSRQPPGSEA